MSTLAYLTVCTCDSLLVAVWVSSQIRTLAYGERAAIVFQFSVRPPTSPHTPMASLASASDTKSTDIGDESEPVPSCICIATLLEEHAENIAALRGLVAAELDPKPLPTSDGIACEYDDIFYLRYLLSFTTPKKAVAPVLACFEFREDPQNRRIAEIVKAGTIETDISAIAEAPRWQVAGPISKTDPGSVLQKSSGGGVFVVIRAGMCDSSGLYDSCTKDELWEMNVAHREGSFQYCDKLTRETGLLAKQTMCMDMKGATIGAMMDRRGSAMHEKISLVSANVYPQLQDKFCIVNAPSWMSWLMSIFRKILSKRSMDKVELFTSDEEMWNSEWAKKRLVRELLPSFMGGEVVEADLEPQLTGALRVQSPPPELTVGARSREVVRVDVPFAGENEVKYLVSVMARGVEFSAHFSAGTEKSKSEEKADKSAGREKSVLQKSSKIKAEDGPIRGSWTVQGPGTVELHFDNTYSMLRSKTVKYTVEVCPVVPEGHEAEAEGVF